MKTFISTTTFAEYSDEPLKLLRSYKINYILNPYQRKLKQHEIKEILKKDNYNGLLAGTETLTREVLESVSSLKVISRVGVGLDNLDLNAAKALKIKVYNTPDVLVDSVGELTIGLILCCLRKINSLDKNVRVKIWKKEMGALFKDKILGIIGFGNIGRKVAQLANAFGAKIIFYDLRPIKSAIARQVSIEELLKTSDIISIHCSAKDTLIAAKEISKMKKGVVLVNTARGGIVDEDSLFQGLSSGRIGFAALDVYREEPYSGKLLELGNVVFTPHIGSYAREARIKMEIEAVKNLIKGLKAGSRDRKL